MKLALCATYKVSIALGTNPDNLVWSSPVVFRRLAHPKNALSMDVSLGTFGLTRTFS